MPTRIWEFALGGALSILIARTSEEPVSPENERMRVSRGCSPGWRHSLALAFVVMTYDRATPYPGIAAAVPALAASALHLGGTCRPRSAITRALSPAPLRWLGRLSYAWYLWHWPLVGLGAVLWPDIGVGGRLALSVAALALAWTTHHLIEQPAREGRFSRLPASWLAPLALLASVSVALVAHGALRIAERQVARPEQQRLADAREDHMQHQCWATGADAPAGACEFGDTRSAVTIALLGDSHAEHWLGALDRAGREHGWKIVVMVKGGCPVADLPELPHARLKRPYDDCTRFREAMMRRILAMRPSAVILSSWDHYVSPDGSSADWQVTPAMWLEGLHRTYARLTDEGLRVAVIRGTPRTWFNVPACLSRMAARLPFAGDCSYDLGRSLNGAASTAQIEAARGLPIRFVDMNDQICATTPCDVVRGGLVVFTDDNHLTASFSRSLAPVLGQRLAVALGWESDAARALVAGGSLSSRAAAILSASPDRRLR